MARTSLPPGFRFHPTDVELVMYYLKRKVMGKKFRFEAISELNIYKFSPWDLPDKSCLKSKDLEWYFFCPRERKYAFGARMNRTTETGFWKSTGNDRPVIYNKNSVGMIKTLVFHQGNTQRGQRTDWVIHEYRIEDKNLAGVVQDAYVLCKVFHKTGRGPKLGAHYGGHFVEEEWDFDEDSLVGSFLPEGPTPVVIPLPENEKSCAAMSMIDLENAPGLSLNEPDPSLVEPSNDEVILDGQNSSVITCMVNPGNSSGWPLSEAGPSITRHSTPELNIPDHIRHLPAVFSEDSLFLSTGNKNNKLGDFDRGQATEDVRISDGTDPFNCLEDPSNRAEFNEGILDIFDMHGTGGIASNVLLQDTFLELDDLASPLNSDMHETGGTASNVLLQGDVFLELDDLATPLKFSCATGHMQTGGLYRSHSSSGSEQMLTGSLCTQYHTSSDLRQCWPVVDFPDYNPHHTDTHQSDT